MYVTGGRICRIMWVRSLRHTCEADTDLRPRPLGTEDQKHTQIRRTLPRESRLM